MLEMLTQASLEALLSLVVGVLPLGAGIAYAVRPTEERGGRPQAAFVSTDRAALPTAYCLLPTTLRPDPAAAGT